MPKLDPKNPDHWIPRDLYAAYVGEGSEGILEHYDKAKAKRTPTAMSFDLFAILAFPAWLGYRRQWLMWATFVGLIGVAPVVEHLAGWDLPSSVFVGMGLAMGMLARGFLLMSATARYAKLKNQGLDHERIRTAMQDGARRSPLLAMVGGLGAVAIVVGLSILAEVTFG
jgi:hypothetical protein